MFIRLPRTSFSIRSAGALAWLWLVTLLVLIAIPPIDAAEPVRVGVVMSLGGLGDRSFNDATYAGITAARRNLGCLVDVIEPADLAMLERAVRVFAEGGQHDLIIAVGTFANDAIRRLARDFPKQRFAILDSVVVSDNVVSVLFDEEEGSFYAGALAGLLTRSGKIGFLGGMVSPIIAAFERGFERGVGFVRPQAEVLSRYAGQTPQGFNDPETGQRLTQEMIGEGVDVIYHAAGRTGLGLIETARRQPVLVIGVDVDQSTLAPGKVIGSVVKRLDIAMDRVIRLVQDGRFNGRVITLGLKDGGVELALSRFNKAQLTPAIRDRLHEVEIFLMRSVAKP